MLKSFAKGVIMQRPGVQIQPPPYPGIRPSLVRKRFAVGSFMTGPSLLLLRVHQGVGLHQVLHDFLVVRLFLEAGV